MGFNIQPVVNEIIQSTQMTYFPLYSRSWAEVCATNPKGLELFWGSVLCHMAPAHEHSIEWPTSKSGWLSTKCPVGMGCGSQHQNPAQGQWCVHAPKSSRAQEPLPELESTSTPTSIWTSCSLQATLLNGHFLLTGVVSKGETSVGVAVT